MRKSQPACSWISFKPFAVQMGLVVFNLLFLFSVPIAPVQAQAASPVEFLVRLATPAAGRQVASALQVQVRDIGLAELGIYGVDIPAGRSVPTLEVLKNSAWVLDAEPNHPIQALDIVPNDPAFPSQYALTALRAPQGWAIENGSRNIRIAILDSGVDFNHPDLAGQLLPGFDFINIDAYPQDDNGHGTSVAGVAAAATDNGVGMAGVAWQAKILPVKVLGANGNGTYADVAAGIVWASYQGVQVINLSLGGASPSFTLEEAVALAASKGILLVAASGNNGSEGVLYPARYPQVIAVAATDSANNRPSFSTYGPDVDVAAPGVQIYTTVLGGGYSQRSGTSFAAPHVAGLAALLFSMPGQVRADQVRAAIESSALDIGEPGRDVYTGAGLIQMDSALRMIPAPGISLSSPALSLEPASFSPPAGNTGSSTGAADEAGSATLLQATPFPPSRQTELPSAPDENTNGKQEPDPANTALTWLGIGMALSGIGLAVFGYGAWKRR